MRSAQACLPSPPGSNPRWSASRVFFTAFLPIVPQLGAGRGATPPLYPSNVPSLGTELANVPSLDRNTAPTLRHATSPCRLFCLLCHRQ